MDKPGVFCGFTLGYATEYLDFAIAPYTAIFRLFLLNFCGYVSGQNSLSQNIVIISLPNFRHIDDIKL